MTSQILVSPKIVDEIEFYVSTSGEETGMSVAGLARLCGVDHTSLSKRLLAKLSQKDDLAWTPPKCLELYQGNVFYPGLLVSNQSPNSRIVRSEVCAAVIEYYAFDSKRAANATAKHSYRKFAAKGITQWIQEVTGFSQDQKQDKLLDMMQELMGEVKRLSSATEEYQKIRKTTVTVFPRLDKMLADIGEEEESQLQLAEGGDAITLNAWLKTKGVSLDKPQIHSLANLVSQTYRTMIGRDPQTQLTANKHGKFTTRLNVYRPCEFPILDMSLRKLFD